MHSKSKHRIAIIGGGISGLAAAWFLEQSAASDGLSIQLFESSERLGGKIQTLQQDGLTLELGAESFLSRKPMGVELCRQLGIDTDLRGTRPEKKKTFVFNGGKLHRLPEGLTGFVPGNMKSLFSTSLLNSWGKLRVAADFVLPARGLDRSDADESIASFMSRRLGKQAYERLVEPLLCGIYCARGDQLSLNATYPELRKLVQKKGSLIRGLKSRQAARKTSGDEFPPFVTLPRGMSDIIDALQNRLRQTEISLGHAVRSCQRDSAQWKIAVESTSGEEVQTFDTVIMSVPAYVSSKLLQAQSESLSQTLAKIPHATTATVNLWFDAETFSHELDGYGFVIPSRQQNGLTAATWTSSKHYDRVPDNRRLIRAYVGRSGAEVQDSTSDEELFDLVKSELKRTMNLQDEPLGYRVQRWRQGSPQYTLGHVERVQKIEDDLHKLQGLFLCGASYRGVGIPDCIRDGKQAAESTLSFLQFK